MSVFIDPRKGFDTVSHELILKKLRHLGMLDLEYTWFESYLSNRKQFVNLNGCVSNERTIHTGIPQGSLLGILLFQLLINDLFKCLKYSSCILYADNTTIFLIGRSLKFLRVKMQYDLNSLSTWLCNNKLKLNVSKMKAMLLNKEA